ncbi:hypothetical protein FDECE_797 [Fusarium decemcellulare]|nr:hypothetical protein FDECE_797 [Fusarium decemcellulare]
MGWEGEGPNKPRRLKIWIDSLCINQNDLDEKQDQVSRMGEIYAAAGTTVVWLGLHDEYTLDALRCVTKLWAIQFDEWNAYRKGVIDVDERGAMDKIGIVTAQELYALGRFLLRNWFRRVWILQEVVLARKIEVRCGPMQFDWDKLCHACGYMTHTNIDLWIWRHLETSIPAPGLFEEMSQRRFLLPALVDKMRGDPANRGPLSMHYLSRQQLATDPRDHVYGILGIISNQKEPEPGGSSLVEPNYRVITALAFENAAWALMAAEANALSLLGHVGDKSLTKTELLPSWVPDFSVPCAHVPLERLRTKHIFHASESINQEYDTDEEVGVTGYMSTGHGRPLLGLNLTWQDSSLVVCGRHVDLIVETGPSYRKIVAEGKLGDLFEFVYNSEITAYFTGEHIYHVLWKCLCANTVDGEPAKPELCHDFVTWAGLYIVKLRKERGQPSFAEQLSQLSPSFTLEELYGACPRGEFMAMQAGSVLSVPREPADSIVPSSDDYGRFGNELLRHGYGGRRIFRTKHGYLGTGLESTRPGDCIYIVEGCNVPLVMRPAEGCFHLVGEAYVHGIMHGEFVHAHQPTFAEMRLV